MIPHPLGFVLGQVGSIMAHYLVLICEKNLENEESDLICRPCSLHTWAVGRQLSSLTRNLFMLSSPVCIFFVQCTFELEFCRGLPWYLRMLLAKSCDFWHSLSGLNNSLKRDQLPTLIAQVDLNWLIFGSSYFCCLNSDWLQILWGCFLISNVHLNFGDFWESVGGLDGPCNTWLAAFSDSANLAMSGSY